VLVILLICLGACIAGMLASVVMVWSSNRSALFSMLVGGLLAVGVLACALLIAWLLTRAAYPA
jgi:ABC-type Mn2+/Zn2+ transport system permease subunit